MLIPLKTGVKVALLSVALVVGWIGFKSIRERRLYSKNLDASFLQQEVDGIKIVERDARVVGLDPFNRLELADGGKLALADIIMPDSDSTEFAQARAWLDSAIKYALHVAHGPLRATDESTGVWNTDIFVFSRGGAWCGNTRWYERVPHWVHLNTSLVLQGFARVSDSGTDRLRDLERQAMSYGSGIWKDAESLRNYADLTKIEADLSRAKGLEAHKLGGILVRAEYPDAVPAIRAAFIRAGHHDSSLLALLVKAGDRKTLDDLVTSFVAPSEVYPDEGRYWRLHYLSQLLGGTFTYYREFYKWYQDHRFEIVANKEGNRLLWGDRQIFSAPRMSPSNLHEPLFRFDSDDPFPVQEIWTAEADVGKWMWFDESIIGLSRNGIIQRVDRISGQLAALSDVSTDPNVSLAGRGDFEFIGNMMAYAAGTGSILGVTPHSWQVRWAAPLLLHEDQGIGRAKNRFLVPLQSGELVALESESGHVAWRVVLSSGQERGQPRFASWPPIVPLQLRERILAQTGTQLLWLAPETGATEREAAHPFTRVSSQPVLWDESLYVTDNGNVLVALAFGDGTVRWSAPIGSFCWPINATVVALPEGVVVNAPRSIAMYSHHDGTLLRRKVFKGGGFRPMYQVTDRYLFALVSQEEPGGRQDGAILVALNREDWSTVGEWPLSKGARMVSRPFLADADYVFVVEPPFSLRCFRVFPTGLNGLNRAAGARSRDSTRN